MENKPAGKAASYGIAQGDVNLGWCVLAGWSASTEWANENDESIVLR